MISHHNISDDLEFALFRTGPVIVDDLTSGFVYFAEHLTLCKHVPGFLVITVEFQDPHDHVMSIAHSEFADILGSI